MGASVGPVLGRAVVRDLYPPREAGRVLGVMSSAMALAPILAPFLGGLLETEFGWRANFVCLIAFGVTLLVWVRFGLPETLPEAAGRLRAGSLLLGYATLLRHRLFLGFMFAVAFAFGALFAWISNASFIVIDHFGIGASRFGFAFGAVIAGYIAGALIGSRLGGRVGYGRAAGLGGALLVVGGAGLVAVTLAGLGGLLAVILLTNVMFVGAGIVIPQATAGALVPFPERAGAAAALVGFVQMSTGFAVNALSASAFDGTPLPFALISAACATLTLLVCALLVRPAERALSAAE
jgi:DHA1 family bicyclomycin/chloramphenicol resistance-like MFS transporter